MGAGKAGRAAAGAAGAAADAAQAAGRAADGLPGWASGLSAAQYKGLVAGAKAYGIEPEAMLDLRNRALAAGATSADFKQGRDHLMRFIAEKEGASAAAAATPAAGPTPGREAFTPPKDGWPSGTESFAAPAATRDDMLAFLLRSPEEGGAGFTRDVVGGMDDAAIKETYDQVKPVVDKAAAKRGGRPKKTAAEDITSNIAQDPASRPPSGESDTLPSTDGAVEAATKQAGKRGPGRPRKDATAAAPAKEAKPAAKGAAKTPTKPDPANFETVDWRQYQSGLAPGNPGDWSMLRKSDFDRALNAGGPADAGGTPQGGPTPPPPPPPDDPNDPSFFVYPGLWSKQRNMPNTKDDGILKAAARRPHVALPLAALGYGGYRLLTSGNPQNTQAQSQAMPIDAAEEFLRQRGLAPPAPRIPADQQQPPVDIIRTMRAQ